MNHSQVEPEGVEGDDQLSAWVERATKFVGRLASGSGDETAKIWDSATGKELISLKGHAGGVGSVAFSLDGERLAAAHQDGLINIWERSVSPETKRGPIAK